MSESIHETESVRKYLSAIGAKGGKVKSKSKSDAARINGRNGGRPVKNRNRRSEKIAGSKLKPMLGVERRSNQKGATATLDTARLLDWLTDLHTLYLWKLHQMVWKCVTNATIHHA